VYNGIKYFIEKSVRLLWVLPIFLLGLSLRIFCLVFAECPERFAIPEIMEGTMGKIEIIATIVLWGFVFFVARRSRRARRFAI
jgi:hypothetical protein